MMSRLCLLLAIALTAAAGSASAAAHASRETVVILPFKLLDTSGEPQDQGAAHAKRLARMTDDLGADLDGRFNVIRVGDGDLAACSGDVAKCILEIAKTRGADLVLTGVVHKSSTLIMQIFLKLVDVDDRSVRLSRDLNFRGDNDESWRRAEAFLARQIVQN